MNRTDYSRSGRRPVGASLPPALFQRRPKRRFAVLWLVLLAVMIIVPAALGSTTGEDGRPNDVAAVSDASAKDAVAAVDGPEPPIEAAGRATAISPTAPFARYDGLTLTLPAEEVLLVGYHEASFPDAVALEPIGDALANDNRTKFTPRKESADGPDYVVLSSRGRPQPATSAVDVVLDDASAVLAPVSGSVVKVEPYLLYGQHDDTRIEIVPEGRPDLTLVMIHIDQVRVAVGDRVEAGTTVLADGPNRFPFGSQIDRFFDPDRWPHVHIELKRG